MIREVEFHALKLVGVSCIPTETLDVFSPVLLVAVAIASLITFIFIVPTKIIAG